MLNDEICKLRDKLNKSIEQGDDYDIIYKISVELDELIAKHYEEIKKSKNFKYAHLALEQEEIEQEGIEQKV